MDFAAQSCGFCARACSAALVRVGHPAWPAYTPPLAEALSSCRKLMQLNADLLRERSPLCTLMSAACTAAAVLVCKTCEVMQASCAERGQADQLLKEVGDTCWIAAHACRDLVSGAAPRGPRPAPAP
jgi:hypothetical protein